MYLAVKNVVPQENYMLLLTFENNEKRRFDVKPYLHVGLFSELKDAEMFNTVKVSFDTVAWKNELDLDPELLYSKSIKV